MTRSKEEDAGCAGEDDTSDVSATLGIQANFTDIVQNNERLMAVVWFAHDAFPGIRAVYAPTFTTYTWGWALLFHCV